MANKNVFAISTDRAENDITLLAALANGFKFVIRGKSEYTFFKTEGAMNRVVNAAEKKYGRDKHGDVKNIGPHGRVMTTNLNWLN